MLKKATHIGIFRTKKAATIVLLMMLSVFLQNIHKSLRKQKKMLPSVICCCVLSLSHSHTHTHAMSAVMEREKQA